MACECGCEALKARMKELEEVADVVARLGQWTHEYGAALSPGLLPDTFGEGMRSAKEQVRQIISPAAKLMLPKPEYVTALAKLEELEERIKELEKAPGVSPWPVVYGPIPRDDSAMADALAEKPIPEDVAAAVRALFAHLKKET